MKIVFLIVIGIFFCLLELFDLFVDVEVYNFIVKVMIITWKLFLYDGGSKIMGYIIEKIIKGEDRWKRCNEYLVFVLIYIAKGFEEGKEY